LTHRLASLAERLARITRGATIASARSGTRGKINDPRNVLGGCWAEPPLHLPALTPRQSPSATLASARSGGLPFAVTRCGGTPNADRSGSLCPCSPRRRIAP